VTDSLGDYDFILGRDYMKKYGIDIRFSSDTIEWDGATMEMHPRGHWTDDRMKEVVNMIGEPDSAQELCDGEESYLQAILDAKYEKQDLHAVSAAQEHLTHDEREGLEKALLKRQVLFSGTLGEWPDQVVRVDLKPESLGEAFEDIGRKSGVAKVFTLKSPTDGSELIIIPPALRQRTIKWYHRILVHPGITRLYNTMHQHFTWPKMHDDIAKALKPCPRQERRAWFR